MTLSIGILVAKLFSLLAHSPLIPRIATDCFGMTSGSMVLRVVELPHSYLLFTPFLFVTFTTPEKKLALKEKLNLSDLVETVEVNIRFSETDPMGIVWHGNYLKYLEDGREAFGTKYGIGYMDIYNKGFVAPLVEIDIKYKKALRYGESILIETRYVKDEAAKIVFAYKVMNAKNPSEIISTANSIQVFLDLQGELVLTSPGFYLDWKKKNGV